MRLLDCPGRTFGCVVVAFLLFGKFAAFWVVFFDFDELMGFVEIGFVEFGHSGLDLALGSCSRLHG